MLSRFMSCRDRFRLRYILGLDTADKWQKTTGYGDMWHICEEQLAGNDQLLSHAPWDTALQDHCKGLYQRYPYQREEIEKWYNVCLVQFPEYVKYWLEHPDVKSRTPIKQEWVFDVPYELPSGRIVRLRGKFDSVDFINNGVYLQENKTKGDVDKLDIERQLKYDLQTMMYLLTLTKCGIESPIKGVRYNVVRRPLSGGTGNIRPHAAKATKTKVTPVETLSKFYERLRRDYLAANPEEWFFRIRSEVSAKEIEVFCQETLDPLLEQICWWYDEVTERDLTSTIHDYRYPSMNYRTPFGVWSALEEGGATEYDSYFATGSEVGLRRVDKLFTELQS